MVGGKAAVEAGAVTHGAVRCSAWLDLIRTWKERAKKKFEDAALEKDVMGHERAEDELSPLERLQKALKELPLGYEPEIDRVKLRRHARRLGKCWVEPIEIKPERLH